MLIKILVYRWFADLLRKIQIRKRKKENKIILITQRECFKLQKLGHCFGHEGTLHRTRSHHPPKYYLVESRKSLEDLASIRTGCSLGD